MNPRTKRHGTVLIIVVVIVMLLSLVAYKYLLAMQTEHIATAMYGDRLKARQSAESARDLLKHFLELSRAERDELGGISDNPALFAGHTDAWQATIKTELIKQDSDEPFFWPDRDSTCSAIEFTCSLTQYRKSDGKPLGRSGTIGTVPSADALRSNQRIKQTPSMETDAMGGGKSWSRRGVADGITGNGSTNRRSANGLA